jgi:hypothetical protein
LALFLVRAFGQKASHFTIEMVADGASKKSAGSRFDLEIWLFQNSLNEELVTWQLIRSRHLAEGGCRGVRPAAQ